MVDQTPYTGISLGGNNMTKKKVNLYTDISGNKIGFLTYEYGTGQPGLYIQGGVHGGETTYFIFQELHTYLKENEKHLQKKVMLAPMVNPAAWNQRIYYYTVGKFDLYKGADWNRSYPGAINTLSARNSKILFDLARQYEVSIDLHTARVSKPYTIFNNKEVRHFIEAIGLPYNQISENDKYNGTFHEALSAVNKASFTIESGSHDSYSQENIKNVCDGIKRILQKLQIIQENNVNSVTNKVNLFRDVDTIYSALSGFVQYFIYPQEVFQQNDILCRIFPSDSLKKNIDIRADYDGVMFELPKTHIIWTGDELFRLIRRKDIFID